MKKHTILLAILLTFTPKVYPQANVTRLNALPAFADNVRYDLALTQQLGVIGNNYYGDVQIGKAPFEAVSAFNSHYPLDGYKRTICGTLHSYYIKTEDKVDDDDVHFIVRPEFYSKNLLAAHNQAIVKGNIELAKANSLTRPGIDLISNPDIATVNGIEAYNKTIAAWNHAYYPMQSHFFRDLKYQVLGEIDLPQHGSITKYSQNVPKQELNCACLFGAWVNDRLSVPVVGSYHDYIEIHPTEQAWWCYKKSNNETVYYLGAFGDNSGRFYVRDHYDTAGGDLSFFGTWLTCPQMETFAVPFEIKNKMPTMVYSAEKQVLNGGFVGLPGEPATRVLMYKNDTLLRVHNHTLMGVRFDKVGISKIVNQDTFIKGYVVFQALIKSAGACAGTSISKLTVNKNIKPVLSTTINQFATVKVTLKNIQCLGVDDGNDKEEIIGYAGVTAYSPKTPITKLPIAPKDQENFLLFSRLDQSYLEMAKNQTIQLNESRTFELTNEDYIVINSDLDEDDDNEDGNINDLDDDDDRLADVNDKGKGVKTDILYVKNLIGANKNLETKHVFTSGGTKVVLTFLVERSGGEIIVVKK